MEEARYVLSLGFSGSDLVRAIILIAIGSLFVTSRFKPWKMVLFLFAIDQLWPYISMLLDGHSFRTLTLTVRANWVDREDQLLGFLVRLGGFYVAIRGIYSARRKLHNALPEEKTAANPV